MLLSCRRIDETANMPTLVVWQCSLRDAARTLEHKKCTRWKRTGNKKLIMHFFFMYILTFMQHKEYFVLPRHFSKIWGLWDWILVCCPPAQAISSNADTCLQRFMEWCMLHIDRASRCVDLHGCCVFCVPRAEQWIPWEHLEFFTVKFHIFSTLLASTTVYMIQQGTK